MTEINIISILLTLVLMVDYCKYCKQYKKDLDATGAIVMLIVFGLVYFLPILALMIMLISGIYALIVQVPDGE